MFRIIKQTDATNGVFVKLVHLEGDDFAVILRASSDGKLIHKYIGPDSAKADEVFEAESAKLFSLVV